MARRVMALLTDFGTRDHYVAAMKGVVLGIEPGVTLVDITHEIPAQDVLSAALELHACWRDFPRGSVFLVVVDPGVGTSRRALAAKAGDRFFVAPDNGVLGMVFDEQAPAVVVEITEPDYLRPTISRTFEGRDRFAPAAAWLARGTDIGAFGSPVSDWIRLDVPRPRATECTIEGEILKADRFGNLVSNIGARMLEQVAGARALRVRVADRETLPLVETYGDVRSGALCALVGSSGYLEIAANGGSAARLLDLGRGARVVVAVDREPPKTAGS